MRRLWAAIWAPAAVFACALAVYLATAPRGLTWAHDSADGAELITAALVAGVPHPPGYPTYTVLARFFAHLHWGTPAWRVTLLSVLSGALAAALVAAIVQDAAKWMAGRASSGAIRLTSLPALTAGLMLAFTPLLWSQSTVVEVYALHACLAALLIWTLSRWERSGAGAWLVLAGLTFGLGLGNHLTTIWLAPLVVVWLAGSSRGSGQQRRVWLAWVGGLALGLLVYLYLPLAAAGDPPVSWGNPRTAAGFLWLVTAELYRPNVFSVDLAEALRRLAAFAALLWRNFLPWGVALAGLGIVVTIPYHRKLTAAALLSLLLSLAWAVGYATTDSYWSLLASWVLIALWAGLGLSVVVHRLAAAGAVGRLTGTLLCVAIAVVPLALHWPAQDLRRDHEAEEFLAHVLTAVEPDALVVMAGDRAIFSLWYARYGLGQRPDLIPVSRDLWGLESYRATVGHAHPELTSPQPPAEWPSLLQEIARVRPVYLVDAGVANPDLAALGLPEESPYWLEPLPGSPGPDHQPVLWRLRDGTGLGDK